MLRHKLVPKVMLSFTKECCSSLVIDPKPTLFKEAWQEVSPLEYCGETMRDVNMTLAMHT